MNSMESLLLERRRNTSVNRKLLTKKNREKKMIVSYVCNMYDVFILRP